MEEPTPFVHRLDIGPVAVYWGDVERLRPCFATHLPEEMLAEGRGRFASISRREEWLAVRLLLALVSSEEREDLRITYQTDGRPVLAIGGTGISISHSKGRVCVALSPGHAVGIDIELSSERAFRLRSMFFSAEDLECCTDAPPSSYTLAWSAKECLYKLMPHQEGLSLSDIHLLPPEITAERGIVEAVVRGRLHEVHYQTLGAYVLTCSFMPSRTP